MSQRAINYVLGLGRDLVSPTQKHVLRTIAEHHRDRFGTADVDLETLRDETNLSRRHLRRIFAALGALVEYTPGLGSGNYGSFRFRSLPQPVYIVREKGTERGQKGDICDTAIRKENLNQDQSQNLEQHDSVALNGDCDPLTAKAVRDWMRIKSRLRESLPSADGALRPTYVLKVMGGCLLLAHPPDGRINAQLKRCVELQESVRAAGYGGAMFTVYPDDYTLQRLAERFPDAYAALAPAIKKRSQSVAS